VCAIYGWTPGFVLNRLTWPEVLAFLRHGREVERTRAMILINRLAEALAGEDYHAPSAQGPDVAAIRREFAGMIRTHGDDEPDVEAIEARYGGRIKRQTTEQSNATPPERATGPNARHESRGA
jgi:hypothetical protein